MVNANWWAAGYRCGQFKVEVFLSGQDNQKIVVKIMRDSTEGLYARIILLPSLSINGQEEG
jgi:hypothetical protein